MDWFELPIASIKKATKSSTTVTFSIPESLLSIFNWSPGQHIRLQFPMEGEIECRNYSISAPLGKSLSITVKAVKNGKVSSYVNQSLTVGQSLNVSPPKGEFVLTPDSQSRRSHYFFAAGSGITPIYSMLVSMLDREPDSFAYLLYGNKDAKSTIFAEELAILEQQYSDRLTICHCHSSPGWFSTDSWRIGRIDERAVNDFIKENPPYAQDTQYFLCGPGSFLPDVKNALNTIDVPDRRIHMESFGGAASLSEMKSIEAELDVSLRGQKHKVNVNKGQSLLQAMVSQGVDAPYSCEGGLCGTCRCRLTTGKVEMANNLILSQGEVNAGEVLACQSYVQTDKISIKFV